MNHLIQIRTSEWVRESFDSDQNLESRFVNHLIQDQNFGVGS